MYALICFWLIMSMHDSYVLVNKKHIYRHLYTYAGTHMCKYVSIYNRVRFIIVNSGPYVFKLGIYCFPGLKSMPSESFSSTLWLSSTTSWKWSFLNIAKHIHVWVKCMFGWFSIVFFSHVFTHLNSSLTIGWAKMCLLEIHIESKYHCYFNTCAMLQCKQM